MYSTSINSQIIFLSRIAREQYWLDLHLLKGLKKTYMSFSGFSVDAGLGVILFLLGVHPFQRGYINQGSKHEVMKVVCLCEMAKEHDSTPVQFNCERQDKATEYPKNNFSVL